MRFLPSRSIQKHPESRRDRLMRMFAVVLPVALATVIILNPGFAVSSIKLNDASVWLTNQAKQSLGRYNKPVEEINGGLRTQNADFDVLQDAEDVLLMQSNAVSVVDPATVTTPAPVMIPPKNDVSMANGIVAVVDTSDGKLWARKVAALTALRTASDEPELTIGRDGRAVVSQDGVILALNTSTGEVKSLDALDDNMTEESVGHLAEGTTTIDEVAAVGDKLFALSAGKLYGSDGSVVDLTSYGSDLALQQSGPTSDTVLVASKVALLKVSPSGEIEVLKTDGAGNPTRPVYLEKCAHGAWASAKGNYLRQCEDTDPEYQTLEEMTKTAQLTFRVNRSVIVLNDTKDGRVWIPSEDSQVRRPNWDDIVDDPEEQEFDESESTDSTENLQAECTPDSGSPAAADDEFGVRAGRSRVLPVISNDSASNCGILAITEFEQIPEDFGQVTLAHDGRALQVSVTAQAIGSVSFGYTIHDGRGNAVPSSAAVHLTVRGEGENSPPEQTRIANLVVEQGSEIAHNALEELSDPDGDDLILVSATSESGGNVRTAPNGRMTFAPGETELGRKRITLFVSDGMSDPIEAIANVDIRVPGSQPPVIPPIMATTHIDTKVTLEPLASLRNRSGVSPRLSGTEEVAGAEIQTDPTMGTFTFSATRAGTYYVPFTVTVATHTATGLARIDVFEWPGETPPPRTVVDVAYLPPGNEILIDPLTNDIDPSGRILVLQTVLTPDSTEGAALKLSVSEHRFVSVSSAQALEKPVVLDYVISNGANGARGEIHVIPVPAAQSLHPPVVANVEAKVRTGGIVTIPVLDQAFAPNGDQLTLSREFGEPLEPGKGLLFVSGNVLRYQAPQSPMTVHATFTVQDSQGNETSALLTVQVHESDSTTKAPPRPRDVTSRVFAGDQVRIHIPLVGIDPDGDGISLLGIDRAPTQGRIINKGADYLIYEADHDTTQSDTFSYAVEDWTGQRAVAQIEVGIAPKPDNAARVVARDDQIVVRPKQKVEYRALSNDVDLNGGELTLAQELQTDGIVKAEVTDQRIVLSAPEQEGEYLIGYTAKNALGGKDSASLKLVVKLDAPILAPIAHDVVVPATETINKTSVQVDVLAMAENPSGPLSDLEVSIDPKAGTLSGRSKITVPLLEVPQTLPFKLTNTHAEAEQISSYAFIIVPAIGDFPPMERPNAPKLKVRTGEPLEISIETHIRVAPAKPAQITDETRVSATKSNGEPLVIDAKTLKFTSEPEFVGNASISFEVTDGQSRDDPKGKVRSFTLPITVFSETDHPPLFEPSDIAVAASETVEVNLAAMTKDTTGESNKFTFRLTSAVPNEFTAVLKGSTLTVGANAGAETGTTGTVELAIGYGKSGTLPVALKFKVIASTRTLAKVKDVTIPDGIRGQARTVSVLEGAINPFDTPLTVVGAVVESGSGTPRFDAKTVTVASSQDFVGQLVVRFRVQDATGDPARVVDGRVFLQVRAKPDAPQAPRIVEVRDKTVVLAWDAPMNNASPIDTYRVVSSPGGGNHDCGRATTCTIDGLSNGVSYNFTVAAHNEIDWSDPSPPSAPAMPDTVPEPVPSLTLSTGDRKIDAAWQPPATAGSPIKSYDLEITPAPNSSAIRTTKSTSYSFTGLQNGVQYMVRVRANNSSPVPGAWSVPVQAVPAGAPSPAVVSARRIEDPLGGKIQITWQPGADNGDPQKFDLKIYKDGSSTAVETIVGASSPHDFTSAVNGANYGFEVVSSNRAGATPSQRVQAQTWGAPGAPTGVTAQGSNAGAPAEFGKGTVVVSWTPPADTGGLRISKYVIRGLGGDVEVGSGVTTYTFDNRIADNYSASVIACNERGGCSTPSNTATATVQTRPDQVVRAQLVRPTPGGPEVALNIPVWPHDGGSPIVGYEVCRVAVSRDCRADALEQRAYGEGWSTESPGPITVWVRVTTALGPSAKWQEVSAPSTRRLPVPYVRP